MLDEGISWSAGTRPRRSRPPALARRALLLGVFALCGALLIGSASELWVRYTIEQQVAGIRAQNAAVQRDITTTQNAIRGDESPATIERKARAWGYTRPGDIPVVIAIR